MDTGEIAAVENRVFALCLFFSQVLIVNSSLSLELNPRSVVLPLLATEIIRSAVYLTIALSIVADAGRGGSTTL